ncbi:MAG: DUF5606 domain-containing protein [Cytophagales bacterium]|nr:DUF5606 domain-containing protein [Bernardetiaceae bacterium]MDW8204849.1 DUF5606 domain-containing protein [Cytophagales bacterium]
MDLTNIAAVAGKPGLYRVIKPTRTGVILESIDDKRTRFAVGMNSRVSVLKEVAIYAYNAEGSVPLADVFRSMYQWQGEVPSPNASAQELTTFLAEILPDFDRDKVYPSDIKKIITWFNILAKYEPQLFSSEDKNQPTESFDK